MRNKKPAGFAKLSLIVSVTIVCIGFLFVVAPLQAAGQIYAVIEYIKVKPEDHLKYLEVEQKIWKPMHQERINQGIIASWTLYAVEFSGSADSYNYVAISTYNDTKNLETPWNLEIPAKVHKNMSLGKLWIVPTRLAKL